MFAYFVAGQQRLQQEVSRIRSQNTYNLTIGALGSVAAALVLSTFYWDSHASSRVWQWPQSFFEYLPRSVVAISIEIFAFFFLRLYKLGLPEVKFFQNELTNLEARFAAVEVALERSDAPALASTIESLLAVERNFVLKRGEVAVDSDRQKSELDLMRQALTTIAGFIPGPKG